MSTSPPTSVFLSPPLQVSPHFSKLRPSILRQRRHAPTMSTSANWAELSRRAQTTLATIPDHPKTYTDNLRAHINCDPANPFLWHALIKYLSKSEPPSAITSILEDAVRNVPPGRRGGLFEVWGQLELRRGRVESALALFSRGIVADPFGPLFISLAMLQAKQGLIEDSRLTFKRGSELFPANAVLWRAWAAVEGKVGAFHVARDLWKVAVEKDPKNAKAWYNLALIEKKCGASLREIADVFYRSLTYCPHDSWLRLSLAKLEEASSGTAAAIRLLEPLEKRNDEIVLRALARMESKQGNLERARSLYRRAADVEAVSKFKRKGRVVKTTKSLHAWALMEVRVENADAARNILEEATALCQSDSGVWRALAELETKEGNYERARRAFENAVAIDPSDPRLLLGWGKMEVLANNLQMAESLMSRVAKAGNRKEAADAGKDKESGTLDAASASESDSFVPTDGASSTEYVPMGAFKKVRNAELTPHVLADALRERAMLASRNGQFEDSLALLARASQIEPNYPNGWRLLASQELRLHGPKSAREVYKTALEKVSNREKPKLLHWWGQDEKASGNIEKARTLYRQATCANPDYMSAWLSWGLLEKAEGQLDTAGEIFKQASRRAELDSLRAPFIFQVWGRMEELDCGRPERAAKVFQRGVNLAPTCGPLWSAWGLLEERRGNIDRARELFEKATTTEPKHGSAWHSWAVLEARRCNYERASELFRKGNENEPNDASLLASWANMEGRQLLNIERSRDLFERAVTADPYYGLAWQAWGCIEMKAGSLEKAKQLFLKAAEVRPDDPVPWHTLGVLEAEYRKDYEAAIKSWKKAIEIAPTAPLNYQTLALFEGNTRNNMTKARDMFELGIEKVKKNPADVAIVLQSWAGLEAQKGNGEEARRLLLRSLDVDRRRAETWQSLALIEKSRGNREGARRLVKDGVEAVSPSSKSSCLYVVWGNLEAEAGNIEKARELFAAGVRANPSEVATWTAYASMEKMYGSESRAAEIKLTSEALLMRKGQADVEFV